MATFNELMQKMVNSDYSVLVSFAQEALVNLLPACKKVDPENDGLFMATSIILSAIGADGVLTGLEKKLLADALGQNEDTIQQFIKLYDSRMAELVDNFADNMPDEIKSHVIMLVTSVAAVDEKISREETALIRKIME
jgi:uncharacterized tellurite resistance protein B-like protein